jgi:hypothetical protein
MIHGCGYKIKPYSYKRAEQLGVEIRPSNKQHKKIDILNDEGEVLASVGHVGMKDYPTFLEEDGKEIAEKRRKAYHSRHAKNIKKKGSPGYYAGNILW